MCWSDLLKSAIWDVTLSRRLTFIWRRSSFILSYYYSSRTVETCLRYFIRLWKRWCWENPTSQPRKISTITPGTGSVRDPVWASMLKPGCTETCCKGVFTPGVSGKTQTGLVWFIQPDEDTDIKKTMSTTKLVKMSKWL